MGKTGGNKPGTRGCAASRSGAAPGDAVVAVENMTGVGFPKLSETVGGVGVIARFGATPTAMFSMAAAPATALDPSGETAAITTWLLGCRLLGVSASRRTPGARYKSITAGPTFSP